MTRRANQRKRDGPAILSHAPQGANSHVECSHIPSWFFFPSFRSLMMCYSLYFCQHTLSLFTVQCKWGNETKLTNQQISLPVAGLQESGRSAAAAVMVACGPGKCYVKGGCLGQRKRSWTIQRVPLYALLSPSPAATTAAPLNGWLWTGQRYSPQSCTLSACTF